MTPWHDLVRAHLATLPHSIASAIVDELAQHLADLYDEALREGRSPHDALAMAKAALGAEGARLSQDLASARRSVGDALDDRLTLAIHEPYSPAR